MTFVTLTPKQFDTYSQTVKHRYFSQSQAFGQLLNLRGYQVNYLAWEENGEIKVATISWREKMTSGSRLKIYYGPMTNEPSYLPKFLKGLTDYAKSEKFLEIELNPYDCYQSFDSFGQPISEENKELLELYKQAGFKFGGLTKGMKTSDWHYIKNLEEIDSQTLTNSFSKKGKVLLKKAQSFGINIKKLDRHELDKFKKITEATSDRRSFEDKPLSYYEYLYDSFGDAVEFTAATLNFETYLNNLSANQEKLKIKIDKLGLEIEKNPNSEKKKNQLRELTSQFDTFTVRIKEANELLNKYGKEDTLLAASIFIFMSNESYYFLSGSYTEFNKFYAPALLQEYAITKSLKLGIPSYNLLGIDGNFDGSDGVLRFKQNFNGYIERRPGAFYYYPNPLKYKFIQALKKILRR